MKVFLDIETQRTANPAVIKRIKDSIRPPGQYKKPESIAQWYASEGASATLEKINATALDGTFGQLAVIGWAIEDEPFQYVAGNAYTETEMLTLWTAQMEAEVAKIGSSAFWASQVTYVGHNVRAFDLRFLFKRSRILGVKLQLPMGRYQDGVYDTMQEWCGFGEYVKGVELEQAFGITREDPLPNGGSDVGDAIDEGRWDDVIQHCRIDVINNRLVYKRMVQA